MLSAEYILVLRMSSQNNLVISKSILLTQKKLLLDLIPLDLHALNIFSSFHVLNLKFIIE